MMIPTPLAVTCTRPSSRRSPTRSLVGPAGLVVNVSSSQCGHWPAPDVGWAACSGGPVAAFEDDDGCLDRAAGGVAVKADIDLGPALPQPITLLTLSSARSHALRLLVGPPNNGVGMRLEVEPPCRAAFVPAIHCERDEVRSVFDVADDDVAFL